MSRITGRYARELLDAVNPDDDPIPARGSAWGQEYANDMLRDSAEGLAETVAWLYERESEYPLGVHSIRHRTLDEDGEWIDAETAVTDGGSLVTLDSDGGLLTPDEAVEIARALLRSAEAARNGIDENPAE